MGTTRNFGQIAGVHIGTSAPDILTMLWHNPSAGQSGAWAFYNANSATWQPFAGEYSELVTEEADPTLYHNLGIKVPGTVLAYHPTTGDSIAVKVSRYYDQNSLGVLIDSLPARVLVRP